MTNVRDPGESVFTYVALGVVFVVGRWGGERDRNNDWLDHNRYNRSITAAAIESQGK